MAPLVARIAAIEELVANHITPPPVAETAISQENGTAKFQKDKEGSAKRGHARNKGKNKRPLTGPQQQQQDPHKKGSHQDQRTRQQHKFRGTCFNCRKVGHKALECRSALTRTQKGNGPIQQQQKTERHVLAVQEVPQGQIVPYSPTPATEQYPSIGRVYAVVPHDNEASGSVMEGTSLMNPFPRPYSFRF